MYVIRSARRLMKMVRTDNDKGETKPEQAVQQQQIPVYHHTVFATNEQFMQKISDQMDRIEEFLSIIFRSLEKKPKEE